MLLSMMFSLMLGFSVTASGSKDLDQQATPIMRVLHPSTAKAGVSVLVSGENLSEQFVSAVYVSDGTHDWKVQVTEQTGASLKFVVPMECKPGKYRIMVLINKVEAILLEEPVKLIVIE